MRLLNLLYWSPEMNEVVSIRGMAEETIRKMLEEERIRTLTLDEKVDILHSKALRGSMNEYREIANWIGIHSAHLYKDRSAAQEHFEQILLREQSKQTDLLLVKEQIKQALQSESQL